MQATTRARAHDLKGARTSRNGCVLLLPLQAASLREMAIVARAMLEDGRFRPVVLLREERKYGRLGTVLDDIDVIRWAGHGTTPGPPSAQKEAQGIVARSRAARIALLSRSRRLLRACFREGTLVALVDYVALVRRLRRELVRARQLVATLDPCAVLLSGDRNIFYEASLMRAAREAEVPTVVIPFAYSGRDDVAFMRRTAPPNLLDVPQQRLLKRFVERRYPEQAYDSPYGRMLFFTPAVTLALARCAMLPPRPWTTGGGLSDRLAVASGAELAWSVSAGVPRSKIVVTGEPSHDALHASRERRDDVRRSLQARYSLDPTRRLVICAVPQLAEHAILPWDRHWEEIRFLVGELSASRANVLLSLHPKSERERYSFLEEEFPVRILDSPLREILPAGDLLVGTFTSTVRWAVLLRVPALVVDFYGFRYDIFDGLPGVITVSERAALRPALKRLLEDVDYRESLRHDQWEYGRLAVRFDGKANRRLMDLIEELRR